MSTDGRCGPGEGCGCYESRLATRPAGPDRDTQLVMAQLSALGAVMYKAGYIWLTLPDHTEPTILRIDVSRT